MKRRRTRWGWTRWGGERGYRDEDNNKRRQNERQEVERRAEEQKQQLGELKDFHLVFSENSTLLNLHEDFLLIKITLSVINHKSELLK